MNVVIAEDSIHVQSAYTCRHACTEDVLY